MSSWLASQAAAVMEALSRAVRQPAGFALNALALAIVLALPFFGANLLESLRPLVGRMTVEPEISVFLSMETTRARSTVLANEIRNMLTSGGVVGEIAFVPRESALATLGSRAGSGIGEAVATLGTNPLPDAFVIKLTGLHGAAEAASVVALAAGLKALPGVEFVQVDAAWVSRVAAFADMLRNGLLALAMVLAIVVVVVVFNTIRLQMLNQHDQIRVALLMGATESYVAAPFYCGGALLGLVAGAAAWLAVIVSWLPVSASLEAIVRLYGMDFRLAAVSPLLGLAMLGASTGLGLVGAMLSAGRQLRRTATPL
jgi:cell division transport system permease protein